MERHGVQLVAGLFFLALAASEAVIGTAIVATKRRGFYLERRKDNPKLFWFDVALTAAMGCAGVLASVYS